MICYSAQISSEIWLIFHLVAKKWGSQFRLGEVGPSFKEFLASPAMMRLGLVSIKPDVGCTKSFPACYFLRVMPL
jgi:hypothetical protein